MPNRKPGSKAGQQVRAPRNLRLVLAFDGTDYQGWQIQKDQPSVQGILREAIEQITGERVAVSGSGRTDAGTHARGLVANFTTTSRIPAAQFARALNSFLPHDIRVLSARRVPMEFHARHCARSKVYRYQIYRGAVLPPHLRREHYHYPYPLDLKKMETAARMFVGDHDFAGFAAGSGRAKKSGGRDEAQESRRSVGTASTVRRIVSFEIKRRGRRLSFTVEGSGFLRHMVRNMVGTLLEVGRGKMSLEHFRSLFEKRDRSLAGFTVPARGLILLKVRY